MPDELRDYQRVMLARVRGAYEAGRRAPLLVAPTGSGKSHLLRYMVGATARRTLILVHRAELLRLMPRAVGDVGGIRERTGGQRGRDLGQRVRPACDLVIALRIAGQAGRY